jgi:hypothetical protein
MEEADTWDEKIIRQLTLHSVYWQWGGGGGMSMSFFNNPTILTSVVDPNSLNPDSAF